MNASRIDDRAPDEADRARRLAMFFHALGHANRLRIVCRLHEKRNESVGDLADALGLRQSRTSSHLTELKSCGIVSSHRVGRRVHHALADDRIWRLLETGEQIIADQAERVLGRQTLTRRDRR